MRFSNLHIILVAGVVALSACGRKPENTTNAPASAAGEAAPASQPADRPPAAASTQPAPTEPASTPSTAPTPEAAPPVKSKPPEPKRYVLAAGTPISVRTIGGMNTKSAQGGNEFEATLESPLIVDGYTLAKRGASVVGKVVNADQGGRVKGKASLTLALARLRLANGQTVPISTNSVTQEAKSGTKKNMTRTGISTGVGPPSAQ